MGESAVIKTYRFLRLGIVALLLFIFLSVIREIQQTASNGRLCLQPSFSAYYYTPAQSVLVGSLIAIGTCMIVLKGNTEIEDALLNYAGMMAAVVALVPTPNMGGCRSNGVAKGAVVPAAQASPAFAPENVANNVGALLWLGAAALLATLTFAFFDRPGNGAPKLVHQWRFWVGFGGAVVLLIITTIAFSAFREEFLRWGHYTAAGVMFLLIWFVVWSNSRRLHYQRNHSSWWNRYTFIAVMMVLFAFLLLLTHLLFPPVNWLFLLEITQIVSFAVFWFIQTHELWHLGLAPNRTETGPMSNPSASNPSARRC
jgi:hypothetical protein